jgi:hypothetical protein
MSERYRDRTQVNDSKLSRNGGQGAANGWGSFLGAKS